MEKSIVNNNMTMKENTIMKPLVQYEFCQQSWQ